jgi:hypothetical protein
MFRKQPKQHTMASSPSSPDVNDQDAPYHFRKDDDEEVSLPESDEVSLPESDAAHALVHSAAKVTGRTLPKRRTATHTISSITSKFLLLMTMQTMAALRLILTPSLFSCCQDSYRARENVFHPQNHCPF